MARAANANKEGVGNEHTSDLNTRRPVVAIFAFLTFSIEASAASRCVTDLKVVGISTTEEYTPDPGWEVVASIDTTGVVSADNYSRELWEREPEYPDSGAYAHIQIKKDTADSDYGNCLEDIFFGAPTAGSSVYLDAGNLDKQYYQRSDGAIATRQRLNLTRGFGYVKAALWTDNSGAKSYDAVRNRDRETKQSCFYCSPVNLSSEVPLAPNRTFLQIYTRAIADLYPGYTPDIVVTDLRVKVTDSDQCSQKDHKIVGYELMGCMDLDGDWGFNKSYWPSGGILSEKKSYMAKFYKLRIHTKKVSTSTNSIAATHTGKWVYVGNDPQTEEYSFSTTVSTMVDTEVSASFSETLTVGAGVGPFEASASETEQLGASVSVDAGTSQTTEKTVKCQLTAGGIQSAVYWVWSTTFTGHGTTTVFDDFRNCSTVACSGSETTPPDFLPVDPNFATKAYASCTGNSST